MILPEILVSRAISWINFTSFLQFFQVLKKKKGNEEES